MTTKPRPTTQDPLDRFVQKVNFDAPGGCWEWTGYRDRHGYGRFYVREDTGPKVRPAHRWLFTTTVEDVPEGIHLDHLCRNTGCVNPDHLEPVTPKVNIMRGVSPSARHAVKTHCPAEHAYAGSNLSIRNSRGKQFRVCLACERAGRKRRAAA